MEHVEQIKPYSTTGDVRVKSEQVRDMFNNIAHSYDGMNQMMSYGIDRQWRKKCVKLISESGAKKILDVATGTADMPIALVTTIEGASVNGIDLSEGMIDMGVKKINDFGLSDKITLTVGDALNLPYESNTFDAVTIAFGVRNFENIKAGYQEMHRVLKPGGKVFVLELTEPSNPVVKPFYKIYTRGIIPMAGRIVSKDKRAYSYLPESIAAVPAREKMASLIAAAGFSNATWKSLTFGVATIYVAEKL